MNGNVKGVNVASLVRLLRSQAARARRLLPADLHRYLEERVLISSWYPEAEYLGLVRAAAELVTGAPDPLVTLGRIAAQTDLEGIYKSHVKSDPVRTLRSGASLWHHYHDTGEMTVDVESEGRATVTLRGFAAPAREHCRLNVGYIGTLVELAGGQDVRTTEQACVLDGADACAWNVTWAT